MAKESSSKKLEERMAYRRFHLHQRKQEIFPPDGRAALARRKAFNIIAPSSASLSYCQYRLLVSVIHQRYPYKSTTVLDDHRHVFKLIKFHVALYHIVYKARPSFPNDPLTILITIRITIQNDHVDYSHHTLILRMHGTSQWPQDYTAMSINILQRLPSYLL